MTLITKCAGCDELVIVELSTKDDHRGQHYCTKCVSSGNTEEIRTVRTESTNATVRSDWGFAGVTNKVVENKEEVALRQLKELCIK